jgi:branched-chain amino acid aminotransferase
MIGLTREGMARFAPGTTLYVRPMYWAERAGPMALPPDPDSTRFALTLYDANARAMFEAKSRGFDNALVCDATGNIAELANSNVFLGKDGAVFTPIANGTFLAGITRKRVIGLLRGAGITVNETVLRYSDFETADEMFSTGNASKVLPITRIGDRSLQPGPLYRKARELYWAFAHA